MKQKEEEIRKEYAASAQDSEQLALLEKQLTELEQQRIQLEEQLTELEKQRTHPEDSPSAALEQKRVHPKDSPSKVRDMGMFDQIWSFLSDGANQKILSLFGGALTALFGGAWAIYIKFSMDKNSRSTHVIAGYKENISPKQPTVQTPKKQGSPETQRVVRDVWLLNAVHYIAYNSWVLVDMPLDDNHLTAGYRALAEIKQKAFDGELPIWGRVGQAVLYKPILKEYWEHYDFEILSFAKDDPEEFCTEKHNDIANDVIYNSLMTSKSKVEELWPKQNQAASPEIKSNFVSIHEAVEHVAKLIKPDIDFGHYHIGNDFGPPCKLITEKLRSGELVARGKYAGTTQDPNRIIDKSEWEYRQLKPISCLHWHDDHPQTESKGSEEDHKQLTAVKVDFNKVKKLWPVSEHLTHEKLAFKATRQKLDELFFAVVTVRTKATNYQNFDDIKDELLENYKILQEDEAIFEGSKYKQEYRDFMHASSLAIGQNRNYRDREEMEYWVNIILSSSKILEDALR